MATRTRKVSSKRELINTGTDKRYARQVENTLPDDAAKARFNEQVRRESFPMIYGGRGGGSYAAPS